MSMATVSTVPTGENRRARVGPVVLVLSSRPVMSATTPVMAVSAFPAGVRSPFTFNDYDAWQVIPSGDVYSGSNNDVYGSYGIIHSIVLCGNFRAN